METPHHSRGAFRAGDEAVQKVFSSTYLYLMFSLIKSSSIFICTSKPVANMQLSQEVVKSLKKTVEDAVADPNTDIPGASVVVVGKDGKELFAHAAGQRGVSSSDPMTLDNVFWIASCTKMIAGLACMQLVEQGKLHLDDGDEIEGLIPELRDLQVLQEGGKLVPKNKKITLRMLLSHTGTWRCRSNHV